MSKARSFELLNPVPETAIHARFLRRRPEPDSLIKCVLGIAIIQAHTESHDASSKMSDNGLKAIFVLMGGSFLLALLLLERPDYLSTPKMLGGFIAAQLILAAVCKFKQAFFLALMIAFVWAGTSLPDQKVWLQGRWFVLATGAVAGLAIYMKDQNHHF